MLSRINKRIITENIKDTILKIISLSKSTTCINKVQYEKIYKNLTYYDYIDIQNYDYMNSIQKKMITNDMVDRFKDYNNGGLSETSVHLFIKNTNSIIKNYDLSLFHNNQFFYSNFYKETLNRDDTYKKNIYIYDKFNNNISYQISYLYGLNKTVRHV
jgi:phosphoribosylformylglycinamidine (FGAM) synthase-like enzyme